MISQDTGNGPQCCGAEFWAEWLVGVPLRIAGIVLVALVARYAIHQLIKGMVYRAEHTRPPRRLFGSKKAAQVLFSGAGIYSERRAARARTLGSLARSIVTAVIGAIAIVMILEELNYSVGPLLASAGIVGVALGFGAQNLVKDFLSGVMMLLEDQFGVGDVVDLGEAIGVVEAVGLRVTQVRGLDGTVWYVRNGEVLRVGNYGQEWARAILDVRVAYGEDTARARELILDVARELASDPEWSERFIDEPEIWGVEELAADGVVIRLVVKTRPLEQWAISRELRERIKARFDAEGVEIPFPQRTVWFRTGEQATSPPSAATSSASGAGAVPSRPEARSARQPEDGIDAG